jgi:hypothetical protein
VELTVADIEGDDVGRATLKQTIREPTGRGADVDGVATGNLDRETFESSFELEAAPPDETVGRSDERHGVGRRDEGARLRCYDAADTDEAGIDGALSRGTAG